MEMLKFADYEVKFDKRSVCNPKDFKDKFYAMITPMMLDQQKFNLWHSACVEKGAKGYIVFNNAKFNFVLQLKENFQLDYFVIIHHLLRENDYYKLSEYKKLYKDILQLI
jgi:hypothetical protein